MTTKTEFFKIVKSETKPQIVDEYFQKVKQKEISLHEAVKELMKHIPEYLQNASFQSDVGNDETVTVTITRNKKETK